MTTYPIVADPFGLKGDTLWIRIMFKKVTNMTMNTKGGASNITTELIKDAEMRLLAPMDIQENISHTWENAENMISRFNELIASGKKAVTETGTVIGESKNGIQNINIIKQHGIKVDHPLVYKESTPREYSMLFQFADQGDTKSDVFDPVNTFRKYSSASIKSDFNIEFPYVCSFQSENSDLININNAAIVGIQPQYYGPYRDGYPTKCDLQLTVRDLSPLYRSSWSKGSAGLITTNKK